MKNNKVQNLIIIKNFQLKLKIINKTNYKTKWKKGFLCIW